MKEKTPLQTVVDVFTDYYGEDKIDCQSEGDINIILVYFPQVTVTNENDRSIDITELYVKVKVDCQGILIGTFTLNRAEYSVAQWYSDYMHSHINGIPMSCLTRFVCPCLGTGPIKGTCAYLNSTFDENIWRLFTLELDKYIHTESLSGVPYHKLESVGIPSNRMSSSYVHIDGNQCGITPSLISDRRVIFDLFLPYLIEKRPFSFGFNNKYYIADSAYNILVKTSNLFIEWYNGLTISEKIGIKDSIEHMLRSESIFECKIINGVVYKIKYLRPDYDTCRAAIGTQLWEFKGKYLRLNITGIPDNSPSIMNIDENTSLLLEPSIVFYIVNKILRIINYKYGTSYGNETAEAGLSQEEVYL